MFCLSVIQINYLHYNKTFGSVCVCYKPGNLAKVHIHNHSDCLSIHSKIHLHSDLCPASYSVLNQQLVRSCQTMNAVVRDLLIVSLTFYQLSAFYLIFYLIYWRTQLARHLHLTTQNEIRKKERNIKFVRFLTHRVPLSLCVCVLNLRGKHFVKGILQSFLFVQFQNID